jgi:hypothetical protein
MDAKNAAAKVRSLRVQLFVWEYVWGEHAGQGGKCAEIAGFSKKRPDLARKYAWQILRKKNVSAMVEVEQAEKERQCKQRFANVLDEAHHLATSDISETVDEFNQPIPLKTLPLHVRRSILSVEVEHRTEGRGEDAEHYTVTKIKMHPKQPAIGFIAKVSGKLKDRVEHSGNVGMHIIDPYAEQPAKE